MKVRDFVKKSGSLLVRSLPLVAVSGLALAQSGGGSYDTSALTTAATQAAAAVLAVGAAIVAGPKIAVKVWKWIGRAL